MYYVHGYLDGKKVISNNMEHLPRSGDTARFGDDEYAKVIEVIWCIDEPNQKGQRVNIRMKSEAP